MRRVMVRYEVKPERAAENEELVRAVYEELARTAPEGLRYATFRLDDGVSFVHLAETEDGHNPLAERGGVRALPGGHPRALRPAADGDRAARGRVLSLPWRRGRGLMGRRRTRWSTWSCTPATARARARSTRTCCAGAPSGSMPAAPATTRWRWAARFGGGIVQCPTRRPVWLPYVEVDRVDEVTDRAGRLGARVLLEPREGPAGWRSVVATPEGGEIAFWQPRARHSGWGAA